jgi:type VI protein secretion system component VasF
MTIKTQIIRQVQKSLDTINSLDPATAEIVRASYKKAIQMALWFITCVAACATLSSFYVKEKSLDDHSQSKN